jgi:hypothetical protein
LNNKKKSILATLICICLLLGLTPVLFYMPFSSFINEGQENPYYEEQSANYPSEDNPYYWYINSNYTSEISLPIYEPAYDSPLMVSGYYLNLIEQAFSLSPSEEQLLEQNRFVVLNKLGTDDIADAFSYYWAEDLPVFITTDTMLHVWHLIFDKILERTEENIFYPLLEALTIEVGKKASKYSFLDAHTLIFFVVALKIIRPEMNLDIPIEIEQASEAIANTIINQDPISYTELTIRFFDDFSQYIPRGHYTNSETLSNYFRLYKWFARVPFFFDDYAGMESLDVSPEEMINSAIEVTWLLKNTQIKYLDRLTSGLEIWETIISFLDVIMGSLNAITPLDLNDYCEQNIGLNWHLGDIDEEVISQLQYDVLNNSQIPEPEMPFYINIMNLGFESPKTFTLFGEIETLDSISLQNVVHPNIYGRFLPHGLDFTYTCLESNRALELLLTEYPDEFLDFPSYRDTLEEAKKEVNSVSSVKKQTLQWNWISSLKPLAVETPNVEGDIILPEFMNSSAWLDEKLTTIMGSWAQLRHDTILYTKQTYGGWVCSTPTGYVEPYPDFYSSLGQVSQLFKTSFETLKNLGYNFSLGYFTFLSLLDCFTSVCYRLEEISIKELLQEPLTIEDKTFITSIYHQKRHGICGVPDYARGWLPFLLGYAGYDYYFAEPYPNSRSSLIADIYTDPNTKQVLHISTGFLEHIIAYVPSWDGYDIPVVGPVFSYYEFPAPNYNRITNEEWRGILSTWINGDSIESYDFDRIQRGFWAESYMASTCITSSILGWDDQVFEPPSWF